MYKKLILICFLLLLCGCTKVSDNNNYIESVQACLNNHSITNTVSTGYKYYVPRGVRKVRDYDYNQVLLVDKSYMYLYVDIISYYYDKELTMENDNNSFYYQKIDYNGKSGYIKIDKKDEEYFLKIVYHYSKIEGYVDEENLTKVVMLSSIVLNSIQYNDTVIEKILEGDLGQFSEFTYEVDKPEGASSNYSQFLEEYVQKEEETEQLPDE